MYAPLGTARLKNGSEMQIGVVEAPDAAHAEELSAFLKHKGGVWNWHIDRANAEPLDDLETRFYVGKLEGRVIVNIMTVEADGVGILGHVFTKPERRRLGACQAAMERQMQHFRRRGGRALYLGTGYDSPPYRIYQRNGFRSVAPGLGFMSCFPQPRFAETYFASRPASPRPVRWGDWGPLTALTGLVRADWLRSVLWKMEGPTNFESGFLQLKKQLEEQPEEDYPLRARVLETEEGARVGVGTLAPHPLWKNASLLDIFCHPNFWDQAPALIESLKPSGTVHAYADEASAAKAETLKRAGFAPEARLPNRCRRTIRPESLDRSAEDDAITDAPDATELYADKLDVTAFTRR